MEKYKIDSSFVGEVDGKPAKMTFKEAFAQVGGRIKEGLPKGFILIAAIFSLLFILKADPSQIEPWRFIATAAVLALIKRFG